MIVTLISCFVTNKKTIQLSGDILYSNYSSGKIVIKVCEVESFMECSFNNTIVQTPGLCVAEMIIEEPGPFLISATITGCGGQFPDIELLVYLTDDISNYIECIAGGGTGSFSPVNTSDIHIELIEGFCPIRF
ncbi:hypothetical protein ES705_40989 [subsurface metagenome]